MQKQHPVPVFGIGGAGACKYLRRTRKPRKHLRPRSLLALYPALFEAGRKYLKHPKYVRDHRGVWCWRCPVEAVVQRGAACLLVVSLLAGPDVLMCRPASSIRAGGRPRRSGSSARRRERGQRSGGGRDLGACPDHKTGTDSGRCRYSARSPGCVEMSARGGEAIC